jgi:hypothetical protein
VTLHVVSLRLQEVRDSHRGMWRPGSDTARYGRFKMTAGPSDHAKARAAQCLESTSRFGEAAQALPSCHRVPKVVSKCASPLETLGA